MNTTETTIDLQPLLELRQSVEPIHDDLVARVNADDANAFNTALVLFEREETILNEVAATFGRFTDSGLGRRTDIDDMRQALLNLNATGDLCCAVDGYRERRQREAVLAHVPAFIDLLRDDPAVTQSESAIWLQIIEITVSEALKGLFRTCQPDEEATIS